MVFEELAGIRGSAGGEEGMMGETFCGAIEATGFLEYRCRISGVSVEGDCWSGARNPCVPLLAVEVEKGRVAIEDVAPRERCCARVGGPIAG